MSKHKAVKIIDGDTFDVTPKWKFRGKTGNRIRIADYDAHEMGTFLGEVERDALSAVILGEMVKLARAYKIDRGRLVCDVLTDDGENLAEFLTE